MWPHLRKTGKRIKARPFTELPSYLYLNEDYAFYNESVRSTSTNMSISEIALKAGFGGIEHIARYFRKETGMSLREYRRRLATY